MKNTFLFLFLILVLGISGIAQVSINNDSTAPAASAMLDVPTKKYNWRVCQYLLLDFLRVERLPRLGPVLRQWLPELLR